MPDDFLKRFEKLEHLPPESLIKQGMVISRRFERLEVGNKKIEFTITDTVTAQETAAPNIQYYFYCPYCGMANTVDAKFCAYCQHNLVTILAQDFQEKSKLLKRCSCGSMNKVDRKNCWICGKEFPDGSLSGPKESILGADNVIILNIDGHEYRSTDSNLPLEIAFLMAKIRREGYSKELIDRWVKEREAKTAGQNTNLDARLTQVRTDLILRSAGLVIFIIFIILQLRACMHYLAR